MTDDGSRGATIDMPPTEENVSTTRRLGREVILAEAVRFIDAYGRERLTMRRLGSELGVEAMALYRYVPGREQLLDGVVEYVLNELYEATMTGELPASWPEYLRQQAQGVRTLAVDHPRIFPLVATRPPAAPWLRPPLRSLRWVEGFLSGLAEHGFSKHESVVVYRAFSTFLLGHLLLEAGTLAEAEFESLSSDIEFYESNDLNRYPRLSELSAELSQDAFDGEFDDALEALISRISALHD